MRLPGAEHRRGQYSRDWNQHQGDRRVFVCVAGCAHAVVAICDDGWSRSRSNGSLLARSTSLAMRGSLEDVAFLAQRVATRTLRLIGLLSWFFDCLFKLFRRSRAIGDVLRLYLALDVTACLPSRRPLVLQIL